ncbi:unnamed protein product [Timema podura]|uniref:Major facilitator superfamily (MFS) profile domain-containing protein n=1 Tax=Timema podura TaxID=61482 RepID=A0ABN7NYS1_TIMPD|nr:unnamed protein product [Timema podura]
MTQEGVVKDKLPNARGSKIPQYAASLAATLSAFTGGILMVWTSPAMPLLHKMAGTTPLTTEQESWVSSLLALGACVGAPLIGYVMSRFGRKWAILTLGPTAVTSLVIILVTSGSPWWLYVSRLLGGVPIGGVVIVAPIYVAEIAEYSIRGELSGLMEIMFCAGGLYTYIIGACENYYILTGACLIVPAVCFIIFLWMPESPHYLIATHQRTKAVSSLQWLRGKDCDVSEEFNNLEKFVEETTLDKVSMRDLLSSAVTRKAIFISSGLGAFQQLSGISVVQFYTEAIFVSVGVAISSRVCTIIFGIVMVVTALVCAKIVDKVGRKILLLISGVFMSLACFNLGLYLYFQETGHDVGPASWVPIISILVFIIAYVLGFGPLPWTVMAEILPSNAKGFGSSMISAFCWGSSFVITKLFQNMIDLMGRYFAFWLFSFCAILATFFVYFYVPETKNRPLKQIQDELMSNK